jgi:probable F420-dependent oxidoreductase
MRIAIALPQFYGDREFDPEAFRRYVARVEELGFDSAWVQEQVLGTQPDLGPIETLTFAAACSTTLRLGVAVLVSPLHNPVQLAKSLASLDQLSRGRLELGLGIGGSFRDFAAFGLDGGRLVTRFNEGVAVMRALWTEARVEHDGVFWHLDGVAMEPKPFQKPGPPIWFGGGHPDAVRRAVRQADGFIGAGSATTSQFADQVAVARAALAEAGRDPASFAVAKRVYLAVDDDGDRARASVAASLDALYGYFGLAGRLAPVAVAGTPDDVVAGLHAVVEAGAELVLLNPMRDDSEQLERLAAEIVPRLG